jgi:hypothetical protein
MARIFGLKPSERALLVAQKKSVSRLARFFHGSSPDFYKNLGRRFDFGEAGACNACDAAMPSLEELIAHSRRARTKANKPLQPLRSWVVRVATKIGIAAPTATMAPSVSAPTAQPPPTMRTGSNAPGSGRCSASARRRKKRRPQRGELDSTLARNHGRCLPARVGDSRRTV